MIGPQPAVAHEPINAASHLWSLEDLRHRKTGLVRAIVL